MSAPSGAERARDQLARVLLQLGQVVGSAERL
ncbi:MAG: hypothetical protein QOI76_2843, partial [Frankiales bacterium]|nr:hypothetical protein [Frankiales bacterium]